MKHICIYIISFLFSGLFTGFAQTQNAVIDTGNVEQVYGLRIGLDLFKPARTLFDEDYSGFEIIADYRLSQAFYLAAEVGSDDKTTDDDNLTSKGSGNYFKIGVDYNAHKNWAGLNNALYGGLRYGYSSFEQELLSYAIVTQAPFFPPDIRTEPILFENLSAHWVELIFGVKTEVLKNLYLSLHLQLKRLIYDKKPENFENLYIPGFNRTYEGSNFGTGFGYGISYRIPIYKK